MDEPCTICGEPTPNPWPILAAICPPCWAQRGEKTPSSLDEELQRRRSDPDYMERLNRHIEENQTVLDRLRLSDG